MKIVVLYKEESSSDYHRLLNPLKNIKMNKGDSILFFSRNKVEEISLELIKDANFVIFSRISPFDFNVLLEWRNIYGFKIIVDFDDYWELYPHHALYASWIKSEAKKRMIQAIQEADIVTTTTNILRDKIYPFNKNVFVIPNAIEFLGKREFQIKEEVNVLYTGGESHYHDIKTIAPTLIRMNEFPKMNFIAAGYHNKTLESEMFWKSVENLIIKNKNSYFKPQLPFSSYLEHYDIADISIAPLEDNLFNTFKSPLKIIESGSKSLPIICSNISPYKEFKDIPGVRLASNNKEWYNHLKDFYKNPQKIEQEGKELYEFTYYNYSLKHINKLRLELFNF